MSARTPLDPSLGDAFAVRDALAAGATGGRVRANDLARPFHGVRTVGELEPIRSYAPRL